MNISHFVNSVRNKARLLRSGTGLSVVTRTNDLMAAWADLGKEVFDHYEHQDIIDHPITLRDGDQTYELALVEESPGTFIILCANEPKIHVYFELYEGKFQIRFYPEGMDADDAGQQIYEEALPDADPS